ncbi:MAG TPA: ABC transporter permease subunit [Streptosporangiaceae bacterium]
MIWLTWRQFRAQAATAVAALAGVVLVYALTGPGLARRYDTSGIATCHGRAECAALTVRFLDAVQSDELYPVLSVLGGALVYLAPAIIGAFWGAPLVTRELESGTYRLAWNQSVTRTRWLAVKVSLIGLAAMVVVGLLSLVLTLWSRPIDRVGGFPLATGQLDRFSLVIFGARDIAPLGYTAFAFTLGVAVGVLVRRTLPAMAVTLAGFAVVMLAWPSLVRPHLFPPVSITAPVAASLTTGVVTHNGEITVPANNLPGAWIISNQTITRTGQVFVLPDVRACATGTQRQCNAWFATQQLRRHLVYQPASRYWAFQWYETAIFLAIALALAGFSVWWIKRSRA